MLVKMGGELGMNYVVGDLDFWFKVEVGVVLEDIPSFEVGVCEGCGSRRADDGDDLDVVGVVGV
jgi:hypothetical protein